MFGIREKRIPETFSCDQKCAEISRNKTDPYGIRMDESAHGLEEQPQAKPKRQLTQGQLDQLAKAREKANAVRKQNAERKKKERRLNIIASSPRPSGRPTPT